VARQRKRKGAMIPVKRRKGSKKRRIRNGDELREKPGAPVRLSRKERKITTTIGKRESTVAGANRGERSREEKSGRTQA